ncbi:MAG: hypothetical protein K2K80_05265 [Clostridia bacterium]|nr:hypothetical protein [Clostridia bacterium]
MDIRKELQRQAEKDRAKLITQGDLDFCKSIVDQIPEKAVVKPRIKKWWGFAGAFVTVLGVFLIIFFTVGNPLHNNYNSDNIVSENATISQIQNDSKCFDLVEPISYEYSVLMYYDKVSGDKLYYIGDTKTDIFNLYLAIVINEKFNYDFEFKTESQEKQLTSYTVNYENLDNTYRGYIKLNTETVYFEYEQLSQAGDEAFFDDIQNLIKAK